jgi:alkanesulfonate monooxygenase SsuD/methylene tetrahydromethanopterin reductase-like flavin-dependent oxidoreductase (luciferase family)
MSVGVISHLHNVSFDQVRALARAAEAAGADWLGLPDAFWWRDSWLLLAEAARATERIQLGPLVTNAYLRHPFHTVAALASLQELAGDRVFLGLGAGGSEVSGAAGVPRRDAAERIEALVALVRGVASGAPLDPTSGRTLEVPLRPLTVLIAGRGDGVLKAAGACADRALLWAIPRSDLMRSSSLIAAGAAERGMPELVWAPLVDHGGLSRERGRTIAAYSVLNSHPTVQARWGLQPATLAQLRALLVGGGAAAAQALVPAAALEDLIVSDPSPDVVASLAASLGATALAVPAFSIDEVDERVGWAREVLKRVAPGQRV